MFIQAVSHSNNIIINKSELTHRPKQYYNNKVGTDPAYLENCILSNRERKEMENMNLASIPLIDYLTNYYNSIAYQVRESTHRQHLVNVATLSHYDIARKPIGDIRRADVRMTVAQMAEKMACSTISKIVAMIRLAMSEAVEEGIITQNPALDVKLPNKSNTKATKGVQPYTLEEQAAFITACEASNHDAGAVNLLLLETGLRIGELLALEFDDVDLKRGTLTVNKTVVCSNVKNAAVHEPKTASSYRTIPLSPKALAIFRKQKEKNGEKGYWFGCRTGRLCYSACTGATKTICAQAGVEYRGEHVLRHTFATNKVQGKAPITTVSRYLGHANTLITQKTYVSIFNTSMDDMRKIVQ